MPYYTPEVETLPCVLKFLCFHWKKNLKIDCHSILYFYFYALVMF